MCEGEKKIERKKSRKMVVRGTAEMMLQAVSRNFQHNFEVLHSHDPIW
jgi:hypothetical protein